MYIAFIENNVLTGAMIDTTKENALNLEITETEYNNIQLYGVTYYLFNNNALELNPNYAKEKANDRQKDFESKFIETSWGWYRKNPKGYSNAPQSIDIIDNMVSKLNNFSAQIDEMMIFYQKPDFYDASQCTEEWLIAHQCHHGPCTKQEFDIFYMDFQSRWALDQYKTDIN